MKLNTRGVAIVSSLATAWLYTAALMFRHLNSLAEYEAPHYATWQLVIFSLTSFALTGYIWALAWDTRKD